MQARTANRIAWVVLGLIAAAAVGFGIYLLIPADDAGIDERTAADGTGSAGDASSTPASGANRTVAATGVPPRLADRSGIVEQVEGHALMLETAGRAQERVVMQPDAQVVRIMALSDISAIAVGDAVVVNTSTIARAFDRPLEDTGRVQRITVLADGLPPEPSPRCPFTGAHPGTVVATEPGRLRIETPCGEESFEVPPTTPVQRLAIGAVTDLRPGQEVNVRGTLLPDGSLSGEAVLIRQS